MINLPKIKSVFCRKELFDHDCNGLLLSKPEPIIICTQSLADGTLNTIYLDENVIAHLVNLLKSNTIEMEYIHK